MDFSLDFGVFGVAVTTLAVILAAMVTSDGSSNWLLGLCFILSYCLIGVCYFLGTSWLGTRREREADDAAMRGL